MPRLPRFSTVVLTVILSGILVLMLLTACQTTTPTPMTPTAAPTTVSGHVVRLTNGEFAPYLSETLPHYGLASRIVSEAFALQGYQVEYGFFPWARALLLAQTGEWDGSVVWHKTPEREVDFYFSDPVVENRDVFFHLKSYAFEWQAMEDLAGLRIGGTIDYNYGAAFMEAEQAGQITVERIASDEQNFQKLLAGRLDIFPLDLEVGLSLLRERLTPAEAAQITYHPLAVQRSPFSLMLSKKIARNAELMTVFNAGLKALTDSGQVQQFIDEAHEGK